MVVCAFFLPGRGVLQTSRLMEDIGLLSGGGSLELKYRQSNVPLRLRITCICLCNPKSHPNLRQDCVSATTMRAGINTLRIPGDFLTYMYSYGIRIH